MLVGGICNFTEKVKHPGGVDIRYKRAGKISKFIHELDRLTAFLNSANTPFLIASIPLMSIQTYLNNQFSRNSRFRSILSPQEITDQQIHLEADIRTTNIHITHLNTSNAVRNLHLDRDITKTTIKSRGKCNKNKKKITKFVYKNFPDGIHPSDDLKYKWFNLICGAIFSQFISVNGQYSSDEEEEDDESWDFKRT